MQYCLNCGGYGNTDISEIKVGLQILAVEHCSKCGQFICSNFIDEKQNRKIFKFNPSFN